MKIVIIRHAKVDMKFKANYDSSSFDNAWETYDISPIKTVEKQCKLINKYKGYKVYISELPRSEETAKQLFTDSIFIRSKLFNEVGIKSAFETEKNLPTFLWNIMGRAQWLFNDKRQTETFRETVNRAQKAIAMLEKSNEDCCVVTHACFMKVFLMELRKRGFKINKIKISIKNLEEFIAIK